MIDPYNITKYDRTTAELEEFLLFSIAVSDNNLVATSKMLNNLLLSLGLNDTFSPFDLLTYMTNKGLALKLKSCGIGGFYNHRAKAFLSASKSGIDLHNCSVGQLEEIHGIGRKTSHFFIMHTRPLTTPKTVI